MEDTIAAISTPAGEGGIAIIRISGPRALAIADSVFVSQHGKPSEYQSHTIHFGSIGGNGEFLDQVMLSVMRAPRSYTTEDVVEINCHGGPLNARSILSRCLQHGARAAEPGEFTRRAFLNGRIDLAQAEAVMDLIAAKTDRALAAAALTLEGHLSRRIDELRHEVIAILAHIEAHIDFPDDDIAPDTRDIWLARMQEVVKSLAHIHATAREGKILREGVSVAIIGRPNVGKSSLMNALLGEERSIVTPVPGTTRDTIEELANVKGIPIRFTDTAGLRIARGTVERIGIQRSYKALGASHLVIHVLDVSKPFSRVDVELLKLYDQRPSIQVLNKVDLPEKLKLPNTFPKNTIARVSSLRGDGICELRDAIEDSIVSGQSGSFHLDVSINERHAEAIRHAIDSLTGAIEEISRNSSPEIVAQSIRRALDSIGEVVGKTTTEDILDKIFGTFCIGK